MPKITPVDLQARNNFSSIANSQNETSRRPVSSMAR